MTKTAVKTPAKQQTQAGRRRTQPEKPAEKMPMAQEQPEIVVAQEIIQEVDTLSAIRHNIDLLEEYTLQSCKDYAKATADIASHLTISALSGPQLPRLQQLEILGNNCNGLLHLLTNIKALQEKHLIAYKPKKNTKPTTEETIETAPMAAE